MFGCSIAVSVRMAPAHTPCCSTALHEGALTSCAAQPVHAGGGPPWVQSVQERLHSLAPSPHAHSHTRTRTSAHARTHTTTRTTTTPISPPIGTPPVCFCCLPAWAGGGTSVWVGGCACVLGGWGRGGRRHVGRRTPAPSAATSLAAGASCRPSSRGGLLGCCCCGRPTTGVAGGSVWLALVQWTSAAASQASACMHVPTYLPIHGGW